MAFLSFIAAGVTLQAPNFSEEHLGVGYFSWLTNSILVAAIIALSVLFFARSATRRLQLIPRGTQNVFEFLVESLYDLLESIVGKHMVAKVFPLLATFFIYILFANWFGLLPGIGSIGWGEGRQAAGGLEHVHVPLLRPATADMNTTAALAVVFIVLWLYWSVKEVGPIGFVKHFFAVKGGLKGAILILLVPIFWFVGIIEIISTIFWPVSLSLRLFGNVYAGENLLTAMITLGHTLNAPPVVSAIMSVIVPIPFYFLELLIGFLQAAVFTVLCAVYIQLSTSHEEGEAH